MGGSCSAALGGVMALLRELPISAGSNTVPGGVGAFEQDLSLVECDWPRDLLGCVGCLESNTETL